MRHTEFSLNKKKKKKERKGIVCRNHFASLCTFIDKLQCFLYSGGPLPPLPPLQALVEHSWTFTKVHSKQSEVLKARNKAFIVFASAWDTHRFESHTHTHSLNTQTRETNLSVRDLQRPQTKRLWLISNKTKRHYLLTLLKAFHLIDVQQASSCPEATSWKE